MSGQQNGEGLVAVFPKGQPQDVVVFDFGRHVDPLADDLLDLDKATIVGAETMAGQVALAGQLVRIVRVTKHHRASELIKERFHIWYIPRFEVDLIAVPESEPIPA